MRCYALGCILMVLIFSSFMGAQVDSSMEIGIKPFGSYHGGDLDSVSLVNGNLVLRIPVAEYPQRGALSKTFYLTYNNKGWTVFPNCNSVTGNCNPFWIWNGQGVTVNSTCCFPASGLLISPVSDEQVLITWAPPYPSAPPGVFTFTATTADGFGHQLAVNQAGGMSTIDGTGIWYDGSAPANLQPGLARDRAGITNALKDPNGNFLTPSASTSTMTDTVGRNLPLFWNYLVTDFSGCTGPLPVANAAIVTLPGFNGSSKLIKLCQAGVPLQTNFQETGYFNSTQYTIREGVAGTDNQMLQSVVLYNGVSWASSPAWTFEYSSRSSGDSASVNYGDLTKITLPTGGTIAYTWGMTSSCGQNSFSQNPTAPVSRAVATRTIDANDGTGPHTWTYSGGLVTDPDGNDTLHALTPLNHSCSMYETETKYFQGSSKSGTLLKTVDTDYRWIPNPFDQINPGNTVTTVTQVFPVRVTTTWPSGKVSKVEKDYDSNLHFFVGTQFTGSYGNVIETREYDYGDGSPGPLLRRTDYTYKAFDGSSTAASYLAANLLNLVSSETVYDGSGNQMSKTTYGYDEYSLQSSGVSTQHDTSLANPGVRGNRTSVNRWLNTTNTTLTTKTTYYDTGTPYQVTDPAGNVTTYSYGAGFQSGSSFAGAYVTQVQNALSQNTYFDYDFGTGLRIAVKDANNQVSTSDYDFLNRTLHSNAPNKGTITWTYNDTQPPSVTVNSSITASVSRTQEADLDGVGRITHAKLTSDPAGTDSVDTTYDAVGRIATISNPHRAASSSTDGTATTYYDALGRITQVAPPDGTLVPLGTAVTQCQANNICTDYSKFPTVTVTDQAGKIRGSRTDGLGRLVEVDEPTGGPVVAQNIATMQTDGNFVVSNPVNPSMWSTGTSGTNASSIMMQDDGNLVLYIFKWSAGVYAAGSPGPFPPQTCSIGTYLNAGGRINANQCIVSPHGQYILFMAADGNFYIYDIAHAIGTWGANTAGHPGAYATLQIDGNFVVYDVNGVALWSSGTAGTYSERLDMEDDGRIIIYRSAWNSGTSTGQFNWSPLRHPGCDVGTGTGWTGVLGTGQCFVSPNGHFELLIQADGNMVINDLGAAPPRTVWNAGTAVTAVDPSVAMRTLYTYEALGNLTCVEQHGTAATGTGCSASPSSDATSPWRVRRFTYDSLSRLLTGKNPESGTITYSYDLDGNLLQKTSPAPNQTGTATQTISYCYDALNRIRGKGYGTQNCPLTSPAVTYGYDSGTNNIGHMISVNDLAGTGSYSYDIMGRLATETRTLMGSNPTAISQTMSYEYNLDGSIKALHYPSGAVVTYTPDSAGRMLSAVDSGNNINYVTGATYGPDGSISGFISGQNGSSGITNKFLYTQRLQPCRMIAATGGTLPASCTDGAHGNVLDLGYDFHWGNGDNGNVWGITNYKDTTRNQTFTYDALNRLTSAQNAGTDCTVATLNGKTKFWGNSYGYDAWGNLINKTVTKCSAENLSVTALANNRLSGYTYDAAGNMTHDATSGLNYAFDQENRITGANGYSYTYDGDGNRVSKSNGTTGTLYWYMTPGIMAETDLSGNLQSEYVFFDGERVARKDFPGNAVSYYFSDHLKTTDIVTDAQGNIKNESDFYPWGGELQFSNGDSNHYKFSGKERDSETGLDYFGARYYSNGLGRFITPDWRSTPVPVPYADLNDPQTLNQYSYVRGLPTTRADADGHCCDTLAGMAEGAWNFVKNTAVGTAQFGVALARDGGNPAHPNAGPMLVSPVMVAVEDYSTKGVSGVGNQLLDQGAQGAMAIVTEAVLTGGLAASGRVTSVAGETAGVTANAAKGAASETRVLNDLGQSKNTQAVVGTEGKSIPDFQTKTTIGEIKDAKTVSNTKQLRIQKEAAQNSGRQHELHTGTNTNVTKPAAQGTSVIRRDDLGPK